MTKEQRIDALWPASLHSKKFEYSRALVRAQLDFPKYSKVKGEWIIGDVVGYGRSGKRAFLKVKDRNGYIGVVPAEKARKVRICEGACGRYVDPPQTRCPVCQARFESICDSYRAMRSGAKDEADLQNRINEFRGGKLDWKN